MPSIFAEEWRECLIAHYTYVVRLNDERTERTLRGVMLEAGFSDNDLRQMTLMATAHVDDVPDDFVPDMELFEEEAPVMVAVNLPEPVAESIEAALEAAVEVEEMLPEEAVLQAAAAAEAPAEEPAEEVETEDGDDEDEPPPPDPDITQLSLF